MTSKNLTSLPHMFISISVHKESGVEINSETPAYKIHLISYPKANIILVLCPPQGMPSVNTSTPGIFPAHGCVGTSNTSPQYNDAMKHGHVKGLASNIPR